VVAVALAPAALPQGMGGGMGRGMGGMGGMMGQATGDGFGFYGVAGYFGYTSSAVPFGAEVPTPQLNLGANYLAGGMVSAGWQNLGPRTDAFVSYTLSYDASLRFSSWNAVDHYLRFGITHDATPRLSYSLSGTAMTIRWDQFLFQPTVLDEVAQTPATYDELVSAVLSGKYTNSQLASILTGAPVLESPAATLLYGTRFFDSSARASLSYELTPRLQFHAGVGGSRTQHLSSNSPQLDGAFLVPVVTNVRVNAGVSYTLSPSTTIGLEAQANRSFSHFEDAYITSGVVTVGRAFGQHWIVQGQGGAGTYIPVRQTFGFTGGPHYVAGVGLTYKGYTQTFMAIYGHTIEDVSGLGAQSADTASAAWLWHRPGRKWALYTGGRYATYAHSALSNLNAWVGNAGIERTLGSHTSMQAGYFYGRNSGIVQGAVANRQLEGVNLVISWTPQVIGL